MQAWCSHKVDKQYNFPWLTSRFLLSVRHGIEMRTRVKTFTRVYVDFAILVTEDPAEYSVAVLWRWLECHGQKKGGRKQELFNRVRGCIVIKQLLIQKLTAVNGTALKNNAAVKAQLLRRPRQFHRLWQLHLFENHFFHLIYQKCLIMDMHITICVYFTVWLRRELQ